MYFIMRMDVKTYKTGFEYFGPFETEEEALCKADEMNESGKLYGHFKFVVQEFSKES